MNLVIVGEFHHYMGMITNCYIAKLRFLAAVFGRLSIVLNISLQ